MVYIAWAILIFLVYSYKPLIKINMDGDVIISIVDQNNKLTYNRKDIYICCLVK